MMFFGLIMVGGPILSLLWGVCGLIAVSYTHLQDAAKAGEWFEKAAGRKDLGAVMELGMMYRDGKYMPPDLSLIHISTLLPTVPLWAWKKASTA